MDGNCSPCSAVGLDAVSADKPASLHPLPHLRITWLIVEDSTGGPPLSPLSWDVRGGMKDIGGDVARPVLRRPVRRSGKSIRRPTFEWGDHPP